MGNIINIWLYHHIPFHMDQPSFFKAALFLDFLVKIRLYRFDLIIIAKIIRESQRSKTDFQQLANSSWSSTNDLDSQLFHTLASSHVRIVQRGFICSCYTRSRWYRISFATWNICYWYCEGICLLPPRGIISIRWIKFRNIYFWKQILIQFLM